MGRKRNRLKAWMFVVFETAGGSYRAVMAPVATLEVVVDREGRPTVHVDGSRRVVSETFEYFDDAPSAHARLLELARKQREKVEKSEADIAEREAALDAEQAKARDAARKAKASKAPNPDALKFQKKQEEKAARKSAEEAKQREEEVKKREEELLAMPQCGVCGERFQSKN